MPMITPSPMVPSMVSKERKSVGRMPKSMRENTQRPRWSVPRGYCQEGLSNLLRMSLA